MQIRHKVRAIKIVLAVKMMDHRVTVLSICICFLANVADAAITSWTDSTDTVSAATASFTKSIAEDTTSSDAIVTLTATSGGTVSSYSVETQPNAGQFEVSSSGAVTLASGKTVDYETATSIVIEVIAVDDTPATGTATLTLSITDVNDFAPSFSAPASNPEFFVLKDGTKSDVTVTTVAAADQDATGNTITYSIETGNTNNDFAIDQSTGKITVAKTLDADTTSHYQLVVRATDAGTDPSTKNAETTIFIVVYSWSCNDVSCLKFSFWSLLVTVGIALMRLI